MPSKKDKRLARRARELEKKLMLKGTPEEKATVSRRVRQAMEEVQRKAREDERSGMGEYSRLIQQAADKAKAHEGKGLPEVDDWPPAGARDRYDDLDDDPNFNSNLDVPWVNQKGNPVVTDDDEPFLTTVDRSEMNLPVHRDMKKRRVTVMKDHVLPYPELWMSVYIHGDLWDQAACAQLFARARCYRAESPEEADLVVFTGGPDVNPALYGEKPHPTTKFSDARDNSDLEAYIRCLDQGIPMFGICRGAQFLHVCNGGKLYQDINGHNGAHMIMDHENQVVPEASSVHHQSCVFNEDGMQVLAKAWKSTERWKNDKEVEEGASRSPYHDIEAFFYRDTMSLGVQGHPEYRDYNKYSQWCIMLIHDFIWTSPDREYSGGYLRIKADLLAERKALRPPKTPELPKLSSALTGVSEKTDKDKTNKKEPAPPKPSKPRRKKETLTVPNPVKPKNEAK